MLLPAHEMIILMPSPPQLKTPTRSAVFPEVQALRAVAVAGVLLYHLWPGIVPGGYVGVDVFFVISGFLITAHLMREVQADGRLRLGRFYARRARRLLPAAFLVIVVTGIAAAWLLPLRHWLQVFRELAASALYVENWALAGDSVDYLAQNNNIASPVQHYWSLSVEEQFYLVWPLLILLGWWLATRFTKLEHRRLVVAGVLGTVFIASLVASIVYTAWQPGPAYFGTHIRAWEFAAGGLLALFYRRTESRAGLRTAASWLGLAAIAATMFLYNEATPFPGYTALLPVAGTVLAIAVGNPGGRLSLRPLLELPPVQYLGDISYSLYLWHWPLIVFAPALLLRDPGAVGRMGVLVIAILLAGLTKRFVEDPVRSSRRLQAHKARVTLLPVLGAMALVVIAAMILSGSVTRQLTEERARAAEVIRNHSDCLGAASLVDVGCSSVDFGASLIPGIDAAPTDDVNSSECWSRTGDDRLKVCSEGPKTGAALRVALVGDSHSNQYLSTLKELAAQYRWRFDVHGKTGCIWTAATQKDSVSWTEECESWKRKLNERLTTVEPYDVVITSYYASSPIRQDSGKSLKNSIIDGFIDVWRPVTERGTQIVAIRDNPRARADYLTCIDRNRSDPARACSVPESDAYRFFDGQPGAVAKVAGAHLLDLGAFFCQHQTCPPVIGGVIVYRDPSHLTSSYARTLTPMLRDGVLTLTGLEETPAP